MKAIFLATVIFVFSTSVHGTSVIEGTIKTIFFKGEQDVALKLNEGFPSSTVQNECPSYNGYAGSHTAPPIIQSALLAAHASQTKVRICIDGCDENWLKVTCVFLDK